MPVAADIQISPNGCQKRSHSIVPFGGWIGDVAWCQGYRQWTLWMGGISSTNSPRSTTLYLRRARVVECFRSENLLKNRFYGQEQEPNVSRQNAYYSVQCNNQPISPCLVHNPVNLIKNKGEQWIIGWFPVEFLQKCFQSRYGVSKLSHRKMVSINAECVLENMALSKQWRKVASIA